MNFLARCKAYSRRVIKKLSLYKREINGNVINIYLLGVCVLRIVFDGNLIHIRGRGFRIFSFENLEHENIDGDNTLILRLIAMEKLQKRLSEEKNEKNSF